MGFHGDFHPMGSFIRNKPPTKTKTNKKWFNPPYSLVIKNTELVGGVNPSEKYVGKIGNHFSQGNGWK